MNKQALIGMTANKLGKMITREIVQTGKNVFAAMAYLETVRPIVEGYKKRILKDMQYDQDISKTYLMPENDFNIYIDRCHEEVIKNGFNVPEKGYCPLLMAESALTDAKHALIAAMYPITGIESKDLFYHGLKDYNNYIDLTLRMLANKIK